jgi:alkylation response protein AidB-like acyl-CoA dehydrogenase
MFVDEAAGGGCLSGQRVGDAVIVADEMGRQVAPGPFLAVNVVADAVNRSASGRRQLLGGLVDGSLIATWAFAEANGRWEPGVVATVAQRNGETIVLTGTKCFVEEAAVADLFLVTARELGGGLVQVLVPRESEGVSVRAADSLDLGRRFGSVHFDAVVLPASAEIDPAGSSAAAVERQLEVAVVLQCAETVGILDRCVEFTLEYMNDRRAFGRPIASFQALKHRMADILLWLESAKATTDALAAAIDDESPEAPRLASVAKSYVGDRSLTIIQECVQFHGGIGVTWEHDLHLYLRRATVNRALYGSPEQHRDRLFDLLELEAA